ncbi:hypothetical protein [Streptomyces marokkonensis]|uniref:hypothetical protein n=1 Tax=Streptomyces marokkonensis TaxID=324855 RepID=UPI00142EC156|nr:hypothetical protein [Streptomyces marokkonensis]
MTLLKRRGNLSRQEGKVSSYSTAVAATTRPAVEFLIKVQIPVDRIAEPPEATSLANVT